MDRNVNLGAGADHALHEKSQGDYNVRGIENLEKKAEADAVQGKSDALINRQVYREEHVETPREHVSELDGMEKASDKAQAAFSDHSEGKKGIQAVVGETSEELTHGEVGLEKQYGIDNLPLVKQMNTHETDILGTVLGGKGKMTKVGMKTLREAVSQQKSDEEILKALEKAVEPSTPEKIHAPMSDQEMNTPVRLSKRVRKRKRKKVIRVLRMDANIDGESKSSFTTSKQMALKNSISLASHEPVQNIEIAHIMEWSTRIVVELNIRMVDGPSTKVLLARINEFNFQPKVEVAFAKQVGPGITVQFSRPFIMNKKDGLKSSRSDFMIPLIVGGAVFVAFLGYKGLKQLNERAESANVGLQRKYRSLDQSPQESDDC